MEKESLVKVGISFITIIVLFILVFSSSAQAFLVGLTTTDVNVTKGNIINFIASITINSDEFININYITLKINKSDSSTNCKFLLNGTIVSGCNGINIKRVLTAGSGYGYGYDFGYGYNSGYGYGYGINNGVMEYNITLNTSDYSSGTYKTFLEVTTPSKIQLQKGPNITINPVIVNINLTECSLRAIDGIVKLNELEFTNNKLNFYIPIKGAKKGNGNLVGQGKNRFTYTFDLKNGLEDNNNRMVVVVSGKLKLGAKNELIETAILTLDKKTNKVSVVGPNINAQNLNVSFIRGCDSLNPISTHDGE